MPDIRTLDGVGDVRARLFAKKTFTQWRIY